MELQRDFYVGTVEDNKDPNRKGRIKVRVQTLYHNLAVEDIPYAYPFAGLAGKEFQVPAIGKLVNVLFLSDDLYSPYYIYSENYNVNLQNKLKSLTDEEYANFSALLFDESTQIFVKGQELTIDQLLNKITINNYSINHELKDNKQKLNLGSKRADQDAVLGTNFFNWMDKFMKELSMPYSLIGNAGAPIMKTKLDILCKEYFNLRDRFVSDYVKIVDNGKVEILSRTPNTINNQNDIDLILAMNDQADQCQEYKQEESQELINLYDAIRKQNEKACERLKNAAPSKEIPIRPIEDNTEELINNRGRRAKNNKKYIDDLHPKFKPYAIRLINRIESELKTKITITSGFRSIEEQQKLIESGNQDAAQPGRSYHQYGLAIDIWPEHNGKVINKNTINSYPFWNEIGIIAKSLGFRWGDSFGEKWHFDMGFGFDTNTLYRKYTNNDIIEDGYVNLDNKNTSTSNNQYSGQEYSFKNNLTSANEPCADSNNFNEGDKKSTKEESDENEGPVFDNSTFNCNEKNAKILLDQISKGEGTTSNKVKRENVQSEYDITYNYGKYTPKTLPNGKPVQPLSSLTISEVKLVQQLMLENQKGNKLKSTAIGKYQFISSTLNELVNKSGLSEDTLFSSEIQDKLAMQKLIDRGYNNWINGKKTDDDFQLALSKEWASIAMPNTNKSYYDQHVGTSDTEIKNVLNQIKNSDCTG